MKVREIMTSDPRTATPDTTLVEIATMMKEEDVGVIPIVDDDRVTGMVSDRDIVVRCIATGKDANDCTAEDVMSSGVKTIDQDADVDEAARLMADAKVRRLAVVKGGKLIGMLSLGDIAVNASEEEEETTAETLEEVSQGVRSQGREKRPSGGRQPQSNGGRDRESGRMQQAKGGRGSQQPGVRGRQQGDDQRNDSRAQGRNDRSDRREREERNAKEKKGAQGISNRSVSREKQSQAKVSPKRAEATGKRNTGGRRAG